MVNNTNLNRWMWTKGILIRHNYSNKQGKGSNHILIFKGYINGMVTFNRVPFCTQSSTRKGMKDNKMTKVIF